jgi:hypothetical protein
MPEPRGSELYPFPLYRDEADQYSRRSQRQSPPGRGQWGGLSGRLAVSLVFGAAAIGMLVTVLTRREPGDLLGAFLVAGTLIAGLAVHPRITYLVIPVPALAYLVAGSIAGLIHDRAADTSRAALAVSAVQWIAHGFLAMTAATMLAAAITAVRWPLWSRARHRAWSAPAYPGAGHQEHDDDCRLSASYRSADGTGPGS